jgi:hypothetical protein
LKLSHAKKRPEKELAPVRTSEGVTQMRKLLSAIAAIALVEPYSVSVQKHCRPFRFIEYIQRDQETHKGRHPNLRRRVSQRRRAWAIPLVMALAAGVAPKVADAQNAAPPASSAVSAEDSFGKGVETFKRNDFPQAAIWFRRAAEQGDARGQAMLGSMYRYGKGVKQDYAQALVWNQKAADQGIADAQLNLGAMYGNGEGVTQDLGKAIEWTQKAAAQGDKQAQENLRGMQQLAQGPSDDEIIRADKDRSKRDAIESVRAEYAGVDKMTTDSDSIFQAKSKAAVTISLECSMNAPKDRPACLEKAKTELLAERAARIKKIQDTDVGAQFIYSVESKKNYEGNYVAVVNVRQRGTDKTFRSKLLLRFINGAWMIAEKSEKEVK